MKKITLSLLSFLTLSVVAQSDAESVRKIYDFYLTESKCYSNLDKLCNSVGARLSGSPEADKAVQWAMQAMMEAGADTVWLQPCNVTKWVRGVKETCALTSTKTKRKENLNVTALGGSVATPIGGMSGKVIEVKSFEDLERLGAEKIKGKIVFYNTPFDPRKITPGASYGDNVKFRHEGASKAAKYGATAVVVRSMSSCNNDVPHTGSVSYDSTEAKIKIPALALSCVAADLLSEVLKQDDMAILNLNTTCKTMPEKVKSFNVIGEVRGKEKPDEYIIAGGHLDSWDVGQGAHDDGAGIVQCIELMRLFKKDEFRPKHSIRAVAFMNEENGLAGAKAYSKESKEKKWKHIAALESDAGGFAPRGFNVDTTAGMYDLVSKWKSIYKPYLIESIDQGGGGADIGPLKKQGVPCIGYEPDGQRYFDIHHTADDTFDKVNKRELELGAAAIGSLLYLIDKNK
jgi:carboxypeptidase Q